LSGFIALVTAHGYSRAMILMPMAHLNYARKQGLGSLVENGITKQTAWAIAAVTAILCTVIGGWAGLAAILTASALTGLWLTYLNHRLGGYTGDGLGAVQQIVEISILLTFAGIIN
jgi:adenosylcobinamide-GDP ribazoletransferase